MRRSAFGEPRHGEEIQPVLAGRLGREQLSPAHPFPVDPDNPHWLLPRCRCRRGERACRQAALLRVAPRRVAPRGRDGQPLATPRTAPQPSGRRRIVRPDGPRRSRRSDSRSWGSRRRPRGDADDRVARAAQPSAEPAADRQQVPCGALLRPWVHGRDAYLGLVLRSTAWPESLPGWSRSVSPRSVHQRSAESPQTVTE